MELFDATTLIAYCAACALLIASPGPGQALIIARTLEGGVRPGVLTAVGLQIGTLVHTLAAALGLSAILATSATAFTVLKYAGAAYLIVLGIMTLRAAGKSDPTAPTEPVRVPDGRIVMHAAITGILNPKVALFFLAFLPQFVHPERGYVLLQFLTLGVILSLIGVAGDSLVAVIAGRVSGRLLVSKRFAVWRERVTGIVLIAIALPLAFAARE